METELRIAIIVAMPPTIAASAALITSIYNTLKIHDLHVIVNSRLTKLLKVTSENERARGRASGIASAKAVMSVKSVKRAKRRSR